MKIQALVVDNNPVLLKAVSSILEKEGCLIQTAENGLEALDILKEFHPDIIFTDLVMPLVDGEQLCRIIRKTELLKNIFVVVLSAIALEEQERMEALDCDFCIVKGLMSEIRIHVAEALSLYRAQCESSEPEKKKHHIVGGEGLEPLAVAEELLSEKRHLNNVLENLQEGFVEITAQGKIVFTNSAACFILGHREEEIIGSTLSSFFPFAEGRKVREWLENAVINHESMSCEISEQTPIFIEERIITCVVLPVYGGNSFFAVCILRDITRQWLAEKKEKELEDAFQLARKLDAMSAMAGGMAHDFNNLLTVICGNLDLALLVDDFKSDKKQLLEQAGLAAMNAVELVRKISTFSSFGVFRREVQDIDFLVNDTVQLFRGKTRNKIKLIRLGQSVEVSIDAEQIAKAITNVLTNSLEAAEGELSIVVEVAEQKFETPTLVFGQYIRAGRYVKIDILDHGRGIAAGDLLKVFDPYFTSKIRDSHKGVGMGLTMTYAILRNHGGYCLVNSVKGEGTTVTFFLPLYLNKKPIVKNKKPLDESVLRKTILLVDDDESLRDMSQIMLEHLHYRVVTAATGDAAVRLYKEKHNTDEKIDAVILDLNFDQGMDGVEACAALRAEFPEAKVIASSGLMFDPAMEDCEKHGFVNILPKPYTLEDLKHVLCLLLE